MKKWFVVLLAAAVLPIFAELPQSIEMESGKLKVRLDGKKKWNLNKIEWNGRLFGIDNPGAHYGMAYQPQGSKFFIGSGHDESGSGEEVISVKIFVNDKEVTPSEKIVGETIRMEKVSKITAFTVKYSFSLENNILSEKTEITSETPVKVNFLYCFMHPWSVRFTKFYALRGDGAKMELTFCSDGSFPNRDFVPAAAWYDPASGLGLATVINPDPGSTKAQRFIWDRGEYRKDYLCDFSHSTFPAGHVAVYTARTGFFQEADSVKWTAEADSLFQKLK